MGPLLTGAASRIEQALVWLLWLALLWLVINLVMSGDLMRAAATMVILGLHGLLYWLAVRRPSPWGRWAVTLIDVAVAGSVIVLEGAASQLGILVWLAVSLLIAARWRWWQAALGNAALAFLYGWWRQAWVWDGVESLLSILGFVVVSPLLTLIVNRLVAQEQRQVRAAQEASGRLQKMSQVSEVGRTIAATLETEAIPALVVARAAAIMDAQAGCLWLLDQASDALVCRAVYGPLPEKFVGHRQEPDEGLHWQAVRTRQGQMGTGAEGNPLGSEHDLELDVLLCAPLVRRDQSLGALVVARTTAGPDFGAADLEALSTIAVQAAIAIENAQLYESTDQALNRRVRELDAIEEIDHELGATMDHDRIVKLVLERAAQACGADRGLLGILAADSEQFDRLFWHGEPVPEGVGLGGIITQVLETGRSQLAVAAPDSKIAGDVDMGRAEMAVPIKGEGRVIGLLKLEANRPEGFAGHDVRFMEHLAEHAAMAIERARLYEETERRLQEFSGLHQISQAIGSLSDLHRSHAQITERIAQLMGVEICGILLYDEIAQALVSQPPFFGVADQVAISYRLPVPEGTASWRQWQERDCLLVNDVPGSALSADLGLPVAGADLQLRDTILAPMIVSGRRIGAIQVANRLDGKAFTEDDARLLCIFANQAAAVVENARLFDKQQEQLHEMGILYETSAAISTSLEPQGVLATVARHIAYALAVSGCSISDWDPVRSELTTLVAILADQDAPAGPQVREEGATYSVADLPSMVQALTESRALVIQLSDPEATPAEHALLADKGQESLLLVPMVTRDRVVGAIELHESRHKRIFTEDEIRLARALANQAAAALENARLYEQTDERLQARVEQLTALQRTTQELNASLELDRMLQTVVEAAAEATGATHGRVLLADPDTQQFVLRAAYGYTAAERTGLEQLLTAAGGISSLAQVLGEGPARVVEDLSVEESALCIRDDIQSALVVPIYYQQAVVGVLNLLHTLAGAFSQDDLAFVKALGDQAAVAIGNAMRFEEQVQANTMLSERAEQISGLLAASQKLRTDIPLEDALEEVAYAIQETVGFNIVLVSIVESSETGAPVLRRVAAAGLPLHLFEEAKATTHPLARYERLFRAEYRQGPCYFLPFQERDDWGADLHTLVPMPEMDDWREGQWHPHDMLLAPMHGAQGRILGHISVDEPRNGLRPLPRTIEVLAIFANQAAIAVENARLYAQARDRADSLALLNQASQQLTQLVEPEQVVDTVVASALTLLPCEQAAVFQTSQTGGAHVALASQGPGPNASGGLNSAPVLELAGRVAQEGEPLIIPDVEQEESFAGETAPIGSLILVPMVLGSRVSGVLAAGSERKHAFGKVSTVLLTTLADQGAVALESTRLLNNAQQAALRLASLNAIGRRVSAQLELPDTLATTVDALHRYLGHPRIGVFMVADDGADLHLAAANEALQSLLPDGYRLPVGEGAIGSAASSGQTVLINDTSLDQEGSEATGWDSPALISVPIKSGGEVMGVLEVEADQPGAFSEEDAAALEIVADQLSVAIVNSRLFAESRSLSRGLENRVKERTQDLATALQELTAERDRAENLYRITSELGSTLELERVLGSSLELFAEALGLEHGTILQVDQETGGLVLSATMDADRQLPREGKPARWRRGEGLAGWILEHREPALVADINEDPRWVHVPGKELQVRSVVAAPLTLGGGDILGVLTLGHPNVGYFTQEHLQLVTAAAAQIAMAVNNSDLYTFITDQAEQLGTALQSQREETVKSQAVLESIADGVLVLDHNGRVLLVNPTAEELLGVVDIALEGEHYRHMLGLGETPLQRELAQALYAELRGRLESTGDAAAQPGAARLEAGNLVVAANFAPLRLAPGDAPGLVAALRDMSREAEVERLKNEFISTVSHELRTPMTSIKGYTDLLYLGMAGGLTETQRGFLKIIKSNADRLNALVNDILDISRIETGRMRLTIEVLPIADLIDEVVLSFQEQYRDKDLTLEWQRPADLPDIRGDADRVTQVLSNLLANAWQYTPQGGQVTISVQTLDDYLQVAVSDNGIGISPDDLTRIFDRFFRADHPLVQEAGGTGLGLSIVRMFVEMLGGEIRVESQLDEGSTFTFTLPLLSAQLPEPEASLLDPELMAGISRRPKILVVEDDRDLALLLRQQLETEGYQVLVAATGRDALWLAKESQPQLITLDIMLPDVDGFAVLEQLKTDPATSAIPVVIVSVLADTERGYALGAVDYIVKPFGEDALLQVVRTTLDAIAEAGPKKLVVADDDPEVLAVLEQALSLHGYQVYTSADGEGALALVQEYQPDLVLLDTDMPRMDGYEVIRQLKADEATRPVPVILITSSPVDRVRRRIPVLATDVYRYVSKPLSIELLIREIKKAIIDGASA